MVQGSRGRTVGCMGRKLCVSQTYTEAPAEFWVDRKPAIPSALENGFCVHHNKKAFLPRGGEEAARLAGSNPSLKGSSVPGPGILDSQNEEGWGWVGGCPVPVSLFISIRWARQGRGLPNWSAQV